MRCTHTRNAMRRLASSRKRLYNTTSEGRTEMNHTTIREQAADLVTLACADCDAAGRMRDWAAWSGRIEDQRTIAANLIDDAEAVYTDQTGEQVTLDAMILARQMLILEADAWLAREAAAEAVSEPSQLELRYWGSAP